MSTPPSRWRQAICETGTTSPGGYSESSTTTTTSYGPAGETTTIGHAWSASFSRSLEWNTSVNAVATGYDFTYVGEMADTSRKNVPLSGTPTGRQTHYFSGVETNTEGMP
ncbi:MAG: hypothetical protein R3C10_15265 [Pirellulales bacterium]